MNAPINLHSVLAALREENDTLRETVRQLREDLAPVRAFPAAWRLQPQQATVLSCIMAASPGVATHRRIQSAMYGHQDRSDWADKLLSVVIYEIRKRMRAAGVEPGFGSIFGVGYRMGLADRDRILAAVAEADQSEAA